MPLRFSVVVSSYNYRAFIDEAVDSALAQIHAPHEIIVVDDGSTDGTPEHLAARYGVAPITVIAQANGGQLSAFIAGVAAASGDVVVFLDADDRWQPDHLQRLAAAYEDPRGFDAVHTNLRCFGARETLWHEATEDRDLGITALETWRFRCWHGSPSSALSMRRGLARQVLDLPADFLPAWRTRADDVLIFGSSLLAAHKAYLAEPSAHYRVHGNNQWLGRTNSRAQSLQHEYRLERLIAHFAAKGGLQPESLRLARREFETQARPDRAAFQHYRALAWQAPLPWTKRLEQAVGMLRHFVKSRQPDAR